MKSTDQRTAFEKALRSDDACTALEALANTLAKQGLSQLELYELFSWYQQRLSPEDPLCDAVVDNMDLIYSGPWAKGRGLFASELKIPSQTPARPRSWISISSTGAPELDAELARELGPEHSLYGQQVRAIARRLDRDDVVFAIRRSPTVAEVHLTWSGRREPTDFPTTRIFASMLDWFAEAEANSEE